jgi:twitching motility protein PilT
MRCRPDYLFLGEISTAEAAEHLLKAVTSGHLVVTTVHAGSVTDTISSTLQLAEKRMDAKTARAVLAERLVAAIHQTLTEWGPRVTLLEPKRGQPNDEITPVLADGDLGALDKHSITFEPLQARVPPGR